MSLCPFVCLSPCSDYLFLSLSPCLTIYLKVFLAQFSVICLTLSPVYGIGMYLIFFCEVFVSGFSLCLAISLPVWVSVSAAIGSLCLGHLMCLSLSVNIYLYRSLSIRVSLYLSVSVSLYLCLSLSLCLSMSLRGNSGIG